MRRWSLGALLLVACKGAEAPPSPPPSPPAASAVAVEAAPASSAAPAAASEPPAPASPCGRLLEDNRKVLPADADTRPQGELDFTASCYPTPQGAWGLRLLDWKRDGSPDDYPTFVGTMQVVHFHGGAEALVSDPKGPKDAQFTLRAGMDYSSVLKPQLVDLNGDGEPEFFVAVDQKVHEGPYYRQARLYQWKASGPASPAGAIQPYPGLPGRYEELEDIDKDGRMDLVYYPYSEEREEPCSGFGYQWRGPAFLAHGRPDGTFVTDDAASREFLRRSCPKEKPKKARGKEAKEGVDEGAPPELCARLEGKSEKEALGVLKGRCRAPKGDEACQRTPGVCGDYHEREGVLKKAPPLVLGR